MKNSTYFKIGLIVSFSLFALIWGINFLKGKGAFNNEDIYYVVYERIDGLEVTNPVLINGFQVGQVRDIHFLPDHSGDLVVEFAIDEEYKLPKKTTARIFSSDLMGTKAIDLIYGKTDKFQQSGDTLVSDFEGSLQELVSLQMLPLKNKAENLMKEMEEAIEIVKFIFNEKTRDDITSSFSNIKSTVAHLENSTSSLDNIVQGGKSKIENILSNVESISDNLQQNNQQITMALQNIANISDSLAQSNLKQVVVETQMAMAELEGIITKINNNEGSLGMLVNDDSLYNNLNNAAYNLDLLVEDLRLNPKRYVQFSAFNLGKTVYVEDYPRKGKKKKVHYKVLLKNSASPIPITEGNFKGYKNIDEKTMGDQYLYIIGDKKNIESARGYLKELKKDFPDAKIVEIKGNELKIVN